MESKKYYAFEEDLIELAQRHGCVISSCAEHKFDGTVEMTVVLVPKSPKSN